MKTKYLYIILFQFFFIMCSNSAIKTETDSRFGISTPSLPVLIKYYQDRYVRLSYTETNCFTSYDYANFKKNKVTEKIVNELSMSDVYKRLIDNLIKLNDAELNKNLNNGVSTFQKTWAEQGYISKTGQTEAGQNAQKEIANVIVDLVKKKLNLVE